MNKINFYQKGFAIPILLGIIALLIIAGGGTYLYLNKKAVEPVTENKEEKINIKNEDINKQAAISPTNTESGTTTSEELAAKEVAKKVAEISVPDTKEMSVKIFLSNRIFNPEMLDCRLVYPITRIIPKTQAVATAALTELIKGPTPEETKSGYVGVIPEGTKINSIKIVNDIIFIDFNKNIENNFASCSGTTRLNAIEKTLLQFPTIKGIKYSVEGNSNPNEILQP